MKLAIMQPYFLPYIGYWQLLSAVDVFVIYDNIQYTKKGWINRNRFLLNGADKVFTIPLKKDSDFLNVNQRFLADDFNREKLIAQFDGAYRKAPFFDETFTMISGIVRCEQQNLFDFVANSIRTIAENLNITTRLVVSSTISIDHSLRAQQKVIATCQAFGASHYVNAIGGQSLYSKQEFAARGISLSFLQSRTRAYPQFGGAFVPNLSIVDVLMFNGRDAASEMLAEYDLV